MLNICCFNFQFHIPPMDALPIPDFKISQGKEALPLAKSSITELYLKLVRQISTYFRLSLVAKFNHVLINMF